MQFTGPWYSSPLPLYQFSNAMLQLLASLSVQVFGVSCQKLLSELASLCANLMDLVVVQTQEVKPIEAPPSSVRYYSI